MVQTEIPNKRWYRPDEVAAAIEEPLSNIMRWIREDKIKHMHFGRKVKIPKNELERLISDGISVK